jgi:hypothetical protein
MVKPEEVEAFLALGQVHDAGLGRLGFQPELGQQRGQPRQRGLGLLPASAHHDQESRRGELHSPPLAEPGVSLSAHRAPIVQPSGRTSRQCANRSGWRRATPTSHRCARCLCPRRPLNFRMAQRTRPQLMCRSSGYNPER